MGCAAVLTAPAPGARLAMRTAAQPQSANDSAQAAIAATAAIAAIATPCSACHMHPFCLPCGLPAVGASQGSLPAFSRRRIACGRALFEQGEEFRFIFAVRSGSFKSSVTLRSGREQVCGFHMSGDVVALDGIASGCHATSAVAIDDSEVCAVAYAPLLERIAHDRAMQRSLSALMSHEIVRAQGLMQLLAQMSAQERMVSFLLDLSRRFRARGRPAWDIDLTMSRSEIGSYLGLTLETVSRALSLLRQQGLLMVDHRRIRILDPDGLSGLCSSAHRCSASADLS